MRAILIIASLIFIFSAVPVNAQHGCNPWFIFGCVLQQETWFPAPLQPYHRRSGGHHGNDREHNRGNYRSYRRENDHKPTVTRTTVTRTTVTRTHVVRHLVHQDKSISQDEARERITGQVKSFCSKYPNDKACHEIEPKKEESR
jgi:hypothetical protein